MSSKLSRNIIAFVRMQDITNGKHKRKRNGAVCRTAFTFRIGIISEWIQPAKRDFDVHGNRMISIHIVAYNVSIKRESDGAMQYSLNKKINRKMNRWWWWFRPLNWITLNGTIAIQLTLCSAFQLKWKKMEYELSNAIGLYSYIVLIFHCVLENREISLKWRV